MEREDPVATDQPPPKDGGSGEPPGPGSSAPPAEERLATAAIADGRERPLDPRFVSQQRVAGWIATAVATFVLLAGWLIVALASPLPWRASLELLAAVVAVLALVAWLGHGWPAVEHRHASFRVSATGIEIRRGVVWRSLINVPRRRIQHTDVSQGPLERWFGLGTLRIHTAGTLYAQVDLPGLDHGTALAVRDHLVGAGEDDAV